MTKTSNIFNSIEDAIKAISRGEIIVVVDDEDRENEGDLICAAEAATPDIINFMAKYGRGLICLPLDAETVKRLNLPLMVTNNNASMGTNFTVSIEASVGVTTGISAADRAQTIKTAINPESTCSLARAEYYVGQAIPKPLLIWHIWPKCSQVE